LLRHASASVLLLLFSSPPPTRALHSFPTRRSSDLLKAGRSPDAISEFSPPAIRRCGQGFRLRLTRLRHRHHRVVWPASRRHSDQDRKSTRLNSSHRTISYAVFCLKKKKKL